MPFLPTLSFAPSGLRVAYRAAPLVQDVHIEVHTAGPSTFTLADECLGALSDLVNLGAAGGAEFAPTAGLCEVLSGPPPGHPGPSFAWNVRWASVSPLFLRNVVDRLSLVGGETPVVGLSVVGSLQPDGGPLSVITPTLLGWLDSLLAYPGRWPNVPFSISQRSGRGAALQVELAEELTPAHHAALDELMGLWVESVMLYVRNDGAVVREGPRDTQWKSGSTRAEYRAALSEFQHIPGPSVDVLVNLLCRFHEVGAPIAHVEVRL